MAKLTASSTAKPQNFVRQLRVGNHDVVEDQWRGESDSVNQVLLNNMASLNPGLVVSEVVALSGDPATITVGKAIDVLYGVISFEADGVIDPAVGTTAAAKDADQVANPGVIDLTGTTPDGWMVVYYSAL